MSAEFIDKSEHLSPSAANINKYASDVARARTYTESFIKTIDFLEKQFKISSSQAADQIAMWQHNLEYPTEDMYDTDQGFAHDLLCVNLYSHVLRRMEMQSVRSEAEGGLKLRRNEYEKWLSSVYGAAIWAEDSRHSIDTCYFDDCELMTTTCEKGLCPLKYIASDVEQDIKRYTISDNEMKLVDGMRLTDQSNFVQDEEARIEMKLKLMATHAIAPRAVVAPMQSSLKEAQLAYNSMFYMARRSNYRAKFVQPHELKDED